MQYAIVIEKAPGSNYGAYVLDLPGCVTVGDTIEEVNGSCGRPSENGLPLPEPTTLVAVIEVAA